MFLSMNAIMCLFSDGMYPYQFVFVMPSIFGIRVH